MGTSNLVPNSARSPHALRNDSGPLPSLGAPPHPSPNPVVFEETYVTAPIGVVQHLVVATHDAPLDGVTFVFYEFFVNRMSAWLRSFPHNEEEKGGCELSFWEERGGRGASLW